MTQTLDLQALKEKAHSLRLDILDMTTCVRSGHPSSSFSSVEILTALYFGGFTFYGVMDCAEEARALNALPVGLAPSAEVVQPVAVGEILTWDDVKLDEESIVVKLRRQQDAL